MKILTTTVARIVFAVPFGIFGLLHFMAADQMARAVPAWIPGGVFWIYFTGTALILASISILIQKQTRVATLLLAILLLIFLLTISVPGLANEATRQMAMGNLLKDMSLMGAALTYAGLSGRTR